MKLQLTLLSILLIAVSTVRAAIFATNTPDKDAFVRALAPTSNYGGAGALSISGTNATGNSTNGAFDSFMSFNTSAMVSNFNTLFGASNWVITSATLNLTANPNPGNAIFNSGTGMFQIRWIANDTWAEGTGNPNLPTTNGITYAQENSILNSNMDVSLGAFDFSGAAKLSCPLGLPAAFATSMRAGGEVGLFMTAIDPAIGYVFYSRNYAGNPSALPSLVVSAALQPVISGISISGSSLVLSATNGFAGGAYSVLGSTNVSLPLSAWTPIVTNILQTAGNFSIVITNGASTNQAQFLILQTQ
jgi:hypothetical protein